MVLDTGLVEGLIRFLTTETQVQILVPILRIFGNLVTGTDQQTDSVIESGCLDHLF